MRVRGNNVIESWVGKSCVNYCVVLNLESGSSFGHLGHVAGIATWGFPRFWCIAWWHSACCQAMTGTMAQGCIDFGWSWGKKLWVILEINDDMGRDNILMGIEYVNDKRFESMTMLWCVDSDVKERKGEW